ncbi:uncharacterized protein N0V89_003066 [Didymosphaeria variabile]|uniref:Uncharacterized protein n=1 Tax=Didymosphaeria variabile TaxID=1932322 RepID=A0A9W8XST8_9PLEO|nr:uncharacterized protein N0V89_003066 [Didymosphaeria variabile]KAJ4358482.1 hypothetical protein N0V89_003066 [Didymosphaeria variabile]
MAKTEEASAFTAREMEVLALAWQCFESEPKIDIKKLARLTGYTEGSASVTIGKIKRKLKAHGAGAGAGVSGGTPASTPKKTNAAKTPKSAKRGADKTFNESPAKKKKAEVQQEDDEDIKVKPEPEADEIYGGYGGYGGYGDYQGGF